MVILVLIWQKILKKVLTHARVKIIEKNKERAKLIASQLNNTIVINGDALDEEILMEANINEVQTVLSS